MFSGIWMPNWKLLASISGTQQKALFCNIFVLVITISKVLGHNLLPKRFYVHEEVLGRSTHWISIFFQPKNTRLFLFFLALFFLLSTFELKKSWKLFFFVREKNSMKTIKENKMFRAFISSLANEKWEKYKRKKYGKDSEHSGKKLNPATNWIIQKLCNFFLCKWVIHACKASTHPVFNPIPTYDPKKLIERQRTNQSGPQEHKKHQREKIWKLLKDHIYVNILWWNLDVERASLQQLCKLSSHVSIEILVTKDAMMDEARKGGMQETWANKFKI